MWNNLVNQKTNDLGLLDKNIDEKRIPAKPKIY